MRTFALLVSVALWAIAVRGDEPLDRDRLGQETSRSARSVDENVTEEQRRFFERRIRPVLVEKCHACHSSSAKSLKGGLRVDTRTGLSRGGDSGPAVVPGKPDESLLILALRHSGDGASEMPPEERLDDAVLRDFERWVRMGAPDPRAELTGSEQAVEGGIDFDAARKFWSLQPPRRHAPPDVRRTSWPRRPIDPFVLARIEVLGVEPNPEIDRRTFLRRVSLDLLGLPPTPTELGDFVHDESPDAHARVVDRLLASPRYGERWGRHWLDVARYAEDNTNMGPHNGPYQHAWRYRDWVVDALNADVPYDEFVTRQLATDLLAETGPEDAAALGLFGLGPQNHKEVQLSRLVIQNRYADDWEDRVDLVGRGLLGLTLACARCHDHKYDPVRATDYYALAGVFASSRQTTRPLIAADLVASAEHARERVAALEAEIAKLEKTIAARKKSANKSRDGEPAAGPTAEEKRSLDEKRAEIERLKQTPHFEYPVANALTEETILVEETDGTRVKLAVRPNRPRDLPVFVRGNAGNHGPVVPRRFLEVLSEGEPTPFRRGSGRLELARAIVSPDNPLAARVVVNRVWMHHFGRGLVATPSNFGTLGERPTHPELLDDLAVRFVENGWSLKWLHREILNSATYRQSAVLRPQSVAVDPDGRWLTRVPRRRLDVEAFRDAILSVSGRLDHRLGGPSGDVDSPAFLRRTVYAKVSRHQLAATLATFDFPEPTIHCAQRSETTTPQQQLFVLNAPFVRAAAESLVQEVLAADDTLADRVDHLHERLFARAAEPDDRALAEAFLGKGGDDREGWARYVHALLASNEFQYVD